MNLKIHAPDLGVTLDEVGYHQSAIDKLDSLMLKLIDEKKLQCASYLMSRKGRIFAHKSMGPICGFEDNGDMMPDSIWGIASITKMFAAVAIMQLVEKGAIYLTQPISAIISEFDTHIHKDITVFHLLTHTSGLSADPGYFKEPYHRDWWGSDNEDGWIKPVLAGPLQSKTGEAWNYSSAAFMILGEIVTRISGIPCEEYILKNIIEPLGMKQTFFDVPDEYHKQVCMVNTWQKKHLEFREDRSGKPPRVAGGIYSTLEDLWKFGQLMLNKGTFNGVRILGRKTVEAMTSNQLAPGIPAFHWGDCFKSFEQGFGWRVTSRNIFSSPGTFGHEGAGRSSLYIDPVEQFVAVVFVPSNIEWVPESIVGVQGVMWSGII